jgi:hypothetical protein
MAQFNVLDFLRPDHRRPDDTGAGRRTGECGCALQDMTARRLLSIRRATLAQLLAEFVVDPAHSQLLTIKSIAVVSRFLEPNANSELSTHEMRSSDLLNKAP